MTLVNRPASGSPKKSEPSPPRMQGYSEKATADEISKSHHIRKFTLDWMGMDAPSDAYLKEMFDFFDKDHSGSLDKKEMMAVFAESLENYGAPIDQRDLDRIFAKFDRDRSGKITFDEFCVMMLSRLKM